MKPGIYEGTRTERLRELRKAIDDLEHKDRFTYQDLEDISKMRREVREIEMELFGVPATVTREFAPFKPLEDTLAEIRNHFAERRKQ